MDQINSKLKQTPTGVYVGSLPASGEVEIGFRQVSELTHYPGIDYVGGYRADIQTVTCSRAGRRLGRSSVDAARAWITFLISPTAAAVFRTKSMGPAGARRPL